MTNFERPAVGDHLRPAFDHILTRYWNARAADRINKAHPVCRTLAELADALRRSVAVQKHPHIVLKWSAGQGNWATVPWIAALDSRETTKTSEGVYVVYLFRADMSGVYLTLNQGTTRVQADFGKGAHGVLKERAARLRKRVGDLNAAGFAVGDGIELRHESAIVRGYEVATVAHKFYARGELPSDAELLTHLGSVLDAYGSVVPSAKLWPDLTQRDWT